MSTIASPPVNFLESLTWVRCLFCLKEFSRTQQFLLFACDVIACSDCAKKLFSREDKRMNCTHCNKKVAFVPIREEMPVHIRKRLESPLKLANEIVETHNWQQRYRALIQNRVRAKVETMKHAINEQRHEIQQCIRGTEQLLGAPNPHRQEILKVISEDRLQQLLQLDENHLKNSTYEQIKGAPPRRRDSGQFAIAPMHSAITASTATTNMTFQSHGSNGSRSSSPSVRGMAQRYNYNHGNGLASTNVQMQPQLRKNRYGSRDLVHDMEPARERRVSHDRRQRYEPTTWIE